MARGVRGSTHLQTIPLQAGRRSTVRLSGVVAGADAGVRADVGGFSVAAHHESHGTFVFWGLPEGTWPVHATVLRGDDSWEGEASVAAGADAEIRLLPSRQWDPEPE